jgi:RNA polymerase sigma factor (sigma-70 family)
MPPVPSCEPLLLIGTVELLVGLQVVREPTVESDESFVWPKDWEKAIPAVTRLVLSVCRRRGLPESDADDMLQVVLLRLMIEATADKRHFASIRLLCGWFRQFLASQLSKREQALSRQKVTRGVDVGTLPDATNQPTEVESMSAYLALLDDPRHHEVISLYYDESLTFQQIADRLGCSQSQVQKLHKAALEQLRRRLAR